MQHFGLGPDTRHSACSVRAAAPRSAHARIDLAQCMLDITIHPELVRTRTLTSTYAS